MLVNGQWSENWQPVQAKDEKGGFVRQQSSFRNAISEEPDSLFIPQQDRYHLYVALICPWANRTLIARALKGLEHVVPVSIVEPFLGDQGWAFGDFPGATADEINQVDYIHELYTKVTPTYTGRATVPVLWDKQRHTIVNNESADIVRIFNSGFGHLANNDIDLYPERHQNAIDEINDYLYPRLNNGVYRAGFATTQQAYNEAVQQVFEALDWLNNHLNNRTYLVSEQLTEADIRAFVTLIRFEIAYFGLFRCNLKHLWQYEHVWAYLERLYAIPEFNKTVNFNHIKQGYYSIKALNPSGIVPVGSPCELVEGDITNATAFYLGDTRIGMMALTLHPKKQADNTKT